MNGASMLNAEYAHNGFWIAAELDLEGKPTGRFLVIDSDGLVVHVAASFKDAMKWVDDQDEVPEPPSDKPLRPKW